MQEDTKVSSPTALQSQRGVLLKENNQAVVWCGPSYIYYRKVNYFPIAAWPQVFY